ncbi:MAG: hypothetical protein WDO70_11860 [Alphaproteobacteria bacterium]
MKRLKLCLSLSALALVGGCNSVHWPEAWKSRSDVAPAEQLPPRTWCYSTLAKAECYAEPRPELASRLINVDPPQRPAYAPPPLPRAAAPVSPPLPPAVAAPPPPVPAPTTAPAPHPSAMPGELRPMDIHPSN